ncbi:MAG: hypothetical protein KZQ77_09185 [Candidatus Thiodiazotropha sp. (ex Notomyrtea botanica)]|nr:hypothetical protein [Candidatus Thiodiazotropha sp. (ex Notomyrtea botanica)]
MSMQVSNLLKGMLFSALFAMWSVASADSHSMMGEDKMMEKSDKAMEMDKSHDMMKEGEMGSMKGDMKMKMDDKMDHMEMEKEKGMMKKGM